MPLELLGLQKALKIWFKNKKGVLVFKRARKSFRWDAKHKPDFPNAFTKDNFMESAKRYDTIHACIHRYLFIVHCTRLNLPLALLHETSDVCISFGFTEYASNMVTELYFRYLMESFIHIQRILILLWNPYKIHTKVTKYFVLFL